MSKTKVDSTGIDLSDNFAFTGTVTGTPGISMADQFRLTTDFTGNAAPIASNLARVNNTGQGTLGSGMSESSGVFTFPSTGIYLVTLCLQTARTVSNDDRIDISISLTTDNSSFNDCARGFTNSDGVTSGDTGYINNISSLIDVTDTSNVKVRFDIANNVNLVRGSSSNNQTTMTFIRLGDT